MCLHSLAHQLFIFEGQTWHYFLQGRPFLKTPAPLPAMALLLPLTTVICLTCRRWPQTASGCWNHSSVQFSSVSQSCLTLCDPMDCSTPGPPVHHQLLEFTRTHVHWVSDAIQPSHPLSSPSLPAFNLSQHQGLFKWVHSSHQVAKVLDFQHQHQSFQWIFRTDFL